MVFRRCQERGREEGGAVLVLVAALLVVFLALLAYTIDLGAGRQGEQKAQAAADAGALAGAEAIRAGTTGAAVTSAAVTVANTNLPGAYVGVTTSAANLVTVSVAAASPTEFGSAAGVSTQRVLASAVASPSYTTTVGLSATVGTSITTGTTTTTGTVLTPGTTVTTGTTVTPATVTTATTPNVAIYAGSSNCSGGPSLGIGGALSGLFPASSVNISGSTVISNGDLWIYSSNIPSNNSTFIYSSQSGCSLQGTYPNNSTLKASSTPASLPQSYNVASLTCTSSGTAPVLVNPSPGVYCGSSTITVHLLLNASLNNVTLIAPTVNVDTLLSTANLSSWTPYAAGYPLALATTGDLTVGAPISLSSLGLNGVLSAPSGEVDIGALNFNGSGLIEGQVVRMGVNTMNFSGSGTETSTTTVPGTTVTTSTTVTTTGTTQTVGSLQTTGTTLTTGTLTTTGTATGPSALTG